MISFAGYYKFVADTCRRDKEEHKDTDVRHDVLW